MLLAIPVSVGIFGGFEPATLVIFLSLLAVSEIGVQFRWRLSLVCRHCGFDPLLYTKNPKEVANRVRAHLERRKNSPEALLGPPLNIPKRSKQSAMIARNERVPTTSSSKSGALLSKRT